MVSPDHIGDYEVLGELGRGGMGIVYRVRDRRDGKVAALKIIPPESLEKKDAALRFKLEFRAMRRVRHPNVCRVFEAASHDGAPYFTMEVVEGQNILEWLDDGEPIVPHPKGVPPNNVLPVEQRERLNSPLRVQRATEAIVQVAFALSVIHQHRIVHRDLKPDNVMVSRAGVVKLMDFGIAKQLSAASENSSGGMVVGTFKYLSPEQALGLDVDGRADLYCLGIVLYELLTGRHPFFSENSVGYAFHHARNDAPPLSKFNPEVHPGLAAVCERLLAKDPNERYPTADETIAAIREATGGREASGPSKRSPKPAAETRDKHTADVVFNPGLVGRDRERRALELVVRNVAQGQGRVVLLPGAKGMGKTRLLRELGTLARPDRVRVVSARGISDGGEYHPWIGVLDRVVAQAVQSRPDEVHRLLKDDGPVLARYLPAAKNISDIAEAAGLEPLAERERFMSSVGGLLERVSSGTPHVVVLDDVHHADELSLDLTRELTGRLLGTDEAADASFASISFVLAFDPDRMSEAAQRLVQTLRRAEACVEIAAAPLTADEVREVVQTMIGGGDVAPAIGAALHQATGGVPGEIVRVVRAWAEAGELRKQKGRWVLLKRAGDEPFTSVTDLPSFDSETGTTSQLIDIGNATRADIDVPDLAADHVVRRKLRKLNDLGRELGERISIFGERILGETLTHLALMTEDELLDALEELIDAEVIQHEPDDGTYRFTSPELRAAMSESISVDRRRRLHRQVADLLAEEARRTQVPASAELLARHFVEGGDLLRALEQLMRAARRALAVGATQTAAERVREAQELFLEISEVHAFDPQVARRDLDLILLRLDVLAAVGEHQQCVQLAQRRLPKIRARTDPRLVGEVLLRLAQSERVLGRIDRALKHVGEVLQLTERGRLHRLRCRAKNLAGAIYDLRGDHDRASRYFGEALELARAIGDEQVEERARMALAKGLLHTGDLAGAEREFTQMLERAEQRGARLAIGEHTNALALIHHERAEYDEAEAGYRRMMKVAKPSGDRRAVAIGLCNVGVIRKDQARLREALNLCDKAARVLSAIDDAATLSYVHIVRSQIFFDDGEVRSAFNAADQALQLAEKGGAALCAAEARMCRGVARIWADDADGLQDIEVGMRTARRLRGNRVILFGLFALASAQLRLDRSMEALRIIDEGLGRARRTDYRRFVDRFESLAMELNA